MTSNVSAIVWMLVYSQTSYVGNQSPKVMVLVGGAFGRWVGHVGGALMNGISALTKEAKESALAPSICEDTTKSLWPGTGPSLNRVGTLISDFQALELWK